MLLFILFLLCNSANSFLHKSNHILIPKLFKEWTCIAIIEHIDFTKPYSINIGELPLIVWKHNNEYYTTINICKHMGSKLDNAIITPSGCLQCQYHGFENKKETDTFGKTIEYQGKLFWSFNPSKQLPESVPNYYDNKYKTSFLEIDMDASLLDSAYNTMDLRHPEYVHNGDKKGFGFGSNIKPSNIKQYKYSKNRVGLSFEYNSSRIVKQMNKNVITKNYHMFIYPSFTWSRVSFDNNHLIIAVNLLPLKEKKTRWFITICHNYYTTPIQQNFMKIMAASILSQDYFQMKNQYSENSLKREVLFQHTFEDEDVILWLNDMFSDYKYPDIDICTNLYKEYKNQHTPLTNSIIMSHLDGVAPG